MQNVKGLLMDLSVYELNTSRPSIVALYPINIGIHCTPFYLHFLGTLVPAYTSGQEKGCVHEDGTASETSKHVRTLLHYWTNSHLLRTTSSLVTSS